MNIKDICEKTPYKLLNDLGFEHFNIEQNFVLLENIHIKYNFIRKKLNSKSKIPLFITVGISYNSFCNNLSVINNNIDKIQELYCEIIFFINDLKQQHIEFTNLMKNDKDLQNYSSEEQIYLINDKMKKILASHYDKIIRKIIQDSKYDQIDLLGVSFGGGVFTFLAQMETIKIRQLILQAPAIFEGFRNVPISQKIILSWCIQDTKVPYKKDGKRLMKELDNFESKIIILTDLNDNNLDDDVTHRLQNGIFDVL